MAKIGRPPLDDGPSVPVNLRLPVKEFDRLDKLARANRETIQDAIRRNLKQQTSPRPAP